MLAFCGLHCGICNVDRAMKTAYKAFKIFACALLTIGACAALASQSFAASFACDKAKTAVEKQICGDAELSTLDEYLGRYYAAARSTLKHADTCFVGDQQNWLRTKRDKCADGACLKRVYLQRLAELDALQPGATSLRNVELPRDMPLVWIVPPALDEVAAPRNRAAKPLVARGRLVDDVARGDGFVIQESDGRKRLLVPLMFLEPPTVDALAGLASLPNASYEARGQSEDGGTHFAASRCTFVYRAAPR